jgi:hypothetical protein
MRGMSTSADGGCICTGRLTAMAIQSGSGSASA